MTMEDFYKYAVDGGFNMEVLGSPRSVGDRDNALVLSPDAWRAVGKVKGWHAGEYTQKAQDMIYSIFAEGKTIEEFIATL